MPLFTVDCFSRGVFPCSFSRKKRDLLLLTSSEITDQNHNAYFFFCRAMGRLNVLSSVHTIYETAVVVLVARLQH